MNTDKAKGKTNEVVGGARQKAGEMTGNESMESKGAAQQLKGKGQGVMGSAKDKVNDLKDKVS